MSIKYFIYARKSTDAEDRQMASIDDQITEMRRLAENLNLSIVDIISEAKTAKLPGRKGFNEMLRRIHKGEARGILCWKLNRLARNPIDGGQISWLLQQNVITHIQTYGGDFKPEDNVLLMQIEFGMATQYVKDLSVDVKRGMRRKAQRGWYPSKPPVGYVHIPRYSRSLGDDEIVPHPKNFELVKKLWQLMLTGMYSVLAIKHEGDKIGLKRESGMSFSRNAYYKMFDHEFYCGYFSWPDEDGNMQRIKGKHKPMVTVEEFQKIQDMIHGEADERTTSSPLIFPYKGLMKCGGCGGHVTAEQKKQAICSNCRFKFSVITNTICPKCKIDIAVYPDTKIIERRYYHCTKNIKPCTEGSITEAAIEEVISLELKKITINKKFHYWGIKSLEERYRAKKDDKEDILVPFRRRETELTRRLENLIRLMADGEINNEEYNAEKKRTNAELIRIQRHIDSENNFEKSLKKEVNQHFDFALNALSEFEKGDETTKKRITAQLASNLTLKAKKLYITTNPALAKVKECEMKYGAELDCFEPKKSVVKSGDWRRLQPSFQLMCTLAYTLRTCHSVIFYFQRYQKLGIDVSEKEIERILRRRGKKNVIFPT